MLLLERRFFMQRARSIDELKPLIRLVRTGRVFDVQEWIAQGKPVNPPPPEPKKQRRKGPLEFAVEAGFHSMVEVLLKAGANVKEPGPNEWSGFNALESALKLKRLDLVKLLVAHGADVRDVSMFCAFETWEPAIMRFFLKKGADPVLDDSFALALIYKVRTALGFYKEYHRQHPELKEQLNLALRYHTKAQCEKWVALLLWAGADPYVAGPWDVGEEDKNTYHITAMEHALWHGWGQFFEIGNLKLTPRRKTALQIFEEACTSDCGSAFEKLTDAGFADNRTFPQMTGIINAIILRMATGAAFLSHLDVRDSLPRGAKIDTAFSHACMLRIKRLFEHGWEWNPSMEDLKSVRRDFIKLKPRYLIDFLKLVRDRKTASHEIVNELVRTPTVQNHIKPERFNCHKFLASITW